jgi:hypothetical protein
MPHDKIVEVSFDALHCALTALVVSRPFVRLISVGDMSPVTAHDIYETEMA